MVQIEDKTYTYNPTFLRAEEADEILRSGYILYDKEYAIDGIFVRIRDICFGEHIYRHIMAGGNLIDCIALV